MEELNDNETTEQLKATLLAFHTEEVGMQTPFINAHTFAKLSQTHTQTSMCIFTVIIVYFRYMFVCIYAFMHFKMFIHFATTANNDIMKICCCGDNSFCCSY